MVKSELIQKLKDRADLSRTHAEKVVDLVFDTIGDTLSNGDRAEIRGFGSFSVNNYQPYIGRNPKTGREVPIPPRRVTDFKPSNIMKQRINDSLSKANGSGNGD